MQLISPMLIAYIAILSFAVYCIFTGFRHFKQNSDYAEYFLARRSLGSAENSASYVARTTSLATVMTFFLSFASREGVYILFAPITVVVGIVIFTRLMGRFKPKNTDFSSIYDYLGDYYSDKTLSIVVVSISVFSIFIILLIELYVGTSILNIFIPDTTHKNLLSLAIVGMLVFSYVAFGGLRSVVSTDRMQFRAMVIFIVLGLVSVATQIIDLQTSDLFPRPAISYEKSIIILPIPLLLNIAFVNFFLIPSLYSTWQMRFATHDNPSFIKGIFKGAFTVLLMWTTFTVIGLLMAKKFGPLPVSLGEIAMLLRDSGTILDSYVVFPVLVVAAFAALLSTADSGIVPISQAVYDVLYKPMKFLIIRPIIITYTIMFAVMFLYYLFFIKLEFDFLKALFSIFGFSIVLTPVIMWAVVFPNDPHAKKRAVLFKGSLLLGFATTAGVVLWGHQVDSLAIIQMAAVYGFLVVLCLIAGSIVTHGKPQG